MIEEDFKASKEIIKEELEAQKKELKDKEEELVDEIHKLLKKCFNTLLQKSMNNDLLNQALEFLSVFIIVLISTTALCILFSSNIKIFHSYDYQAVQKIHEAQVSRLGGLGIFSTFFVCTYFLDNAILTNISLCSIPLFVVALIEDLRHNVKPYVRMIAILISALLFIIPLYPQFAMATTETILVLAEKLRDEFFVHLYLWCCERR